MKRIMGLAAVISVLLSTDLFSGTYTLTLDGSIRQGTVPHFWSRCVGTGGAQLCLKAEWKNAAKIGVNEAGFQAFRGHRILSASNPIRWSGSGSTPTYTWATFDSIYDVLVDTLHTVPVVELSSMPANLQSNGEWSPPKDFTVWGNLIYEVVNHCITRYGRDNVRKWYWEVWNEWDYSGFWNGGNEAKYYQLYQEAVNGAMRADSQLQIGGPSTTGSGGTKLSGFLSFCQTNNLKVNLVTNHCYGGGGSGSNADAASVRNDNRARATAIKNSGKKLLSFNTEYNSSYSGQGGNTGANCYSMDSHVNAPFVAKCVKLILDDHTAGTYQVPDVFSYWAISDVFDEGSYIEGHSLVPFGQVFGLINYKGIRKGTFNGFKMLHKMGTTRLSLTGGSGDADGIDGFATINSDSSQVALLVYNFYKTLAGSTNTNLANITVRNLPFTAGQSVQVAHYRVDSLHSNPYTVWLKLSKPAKPTTAQFDSMQSASNLALLKPVSTFTYSGQAWTDSFTMPQQSLSLILFGKPGTVGTAPKVSPHDRPALSINGTMVSAEGLRGSGIVLSLYGIDGRLVQRMNTMQGCVDLRRVAAAGAYIVSVQAMG